MSKSPAWIRRQARPRRTTTRFGAFRNLHPLTATSKEDSAVHADGIWHLTRVRLNCLLLACFSISALARADTPKCPAHETRLEVTNGEYSPSEGAVFVLHNFSAAMIARGAQSPFCFMRTTDVHRGTVDISVESLRRIFEGKVQESASKVSNIKLKLGAGEVHLSGKLHKGVTIPFSIDGELTTDGTMLILNEKKIHAEGVPVKGLLSLVGIHLSSLIRIEGVSTQGNTLVFAPEKIAHVKGHIQSLDVNPDRLEIVFTGTESRVKMGTAPHVTAQGQMR